MFRVIRIKNSQLLLRHIFADNDVNLTVNNPMFYTDDKRIKEDIKRLAELGIEAVEEKLTAEEEPTEE